MVSSLVGAKLEVYHPIHSQLCHGNQPTGPQVLTQLVCMYVCVFACMCVGGGEGRGRMQQCLHLHREARWLEALGPLKISGVKTTAGLKQKQQVEAVRRFRDGEAEKGGPVIYSLTNLTVNQKSIY